MTTHLQVLDKSNPPPINALSLVERYGDKVHLIAPATDRFSVSSDLMVPYATQIIINPNPQAGDVHDIEGKLVLSAVSLSRLSTAAGIVWSERQTRPLTVTKDYICYRAVGYLRLPDGSSIPLIGTKEIDMDAIAAESRIKKCKKMYGGRAYDSLSEEERRQVDNAVNVEMATFRKHRLARAETGAKTRAIRSLGVRSSYAAAELAKPFTVVRWGINPSHEYAQAERQALWGELSGQMPANPLPALEIHDEGLDEIHGAEETEVEVLSESEETHADQPPPTAADAIIQPELDRLENWEAEEQADRAGMIERITAIETALQLKPRRTQELRIHHAKHANLAEAPCAGLADYHDWLKAQTPQPATT